MKMSAEQLRSLCKQITELLETEEWVVTFMEKDGDRKGAHCMSGICPATTVGKLSNFVFINKDYLMELANKNFQ